MGIIIMTIVFWYKAQQVVMFYSSTLAFQSGHFCFVISSCSDSFIVAILSPVLTSLITVLNLYATIKVLKLSQQVQSQRE